MDDASARAVLGVSDDADWDEIRASYRAKIRIAHPDIAGGTTSDRSLQLNAAYRTLAQSRRSGSTGTPPPQPPSPPRPDRDEVSVKRRARSTSDGAWDVRIMDETTLVFSSTPAETFRRLVEAAHALGDISYIDRSAAIVEAVLELDDGSHASFVASLQWRSHDSTCEAFCTLEALERAETLDVSGVLEQLVAFIPPDRDR